MEEVVKPKTLDECPRCESRLRTVLVGHRKLQQTCTRDVCDWEGKPYTPRKKPVQTTRFVAVGFGGWTFEAFDQYGQAFVSSRSYRSRKECERSARSEIDNWSKAEGYGECVAVLWPPTIKVKGALIKRKKR